MFGDSYYDEDCHGQKKNNLVGTLQLHTRNINEFDELITEIKEVLRN